MAEDSEHLDVSAGHAFQIDCHYFKGNEVVPEELSRGQNQSLDGGIMVMNQSLWFLPAQESHSGNYSCSFRYKNINKTSNKTFSISVAKHKCPKTTPTNVFLFKGIPFLNCDKDHLSKIRQLENVSDVTWSINKNCSTFMGPQDSCIFRFSTTSKIEEGLYTCLMNFTRYGNAYTAALTRNVIITNHPSTNLQKPRVVKPYGLETHTVEIGSIYELNCKALMGTSSKDDLEHPLPYWLSLNPFVRGWISHTESHTLISMLLYFCSGVAKQFQWKTGLDCRQSNTCTLFLCVLEDNMVYCHSNLTIEVKPEFLNIPFRCIVLTPLGSDNGTIILKPASQKDLHCALALVTAFTLVVLGLLMFYCFKVDLVLAYRNYSPCVKIQSDGKVYDAYVSYLHGQDKSVSPASTFALQVLPEVLENQLGYKMFISGRDELPGAAVHDVISEAVGKSRRLIIVLPSQAFTTSTDNTFVELVPEIPSEQLSMNNNIMIDSTENSALNWGPYECWVGLFDALVKGGLKVILVQVGGEIDESLLPGSLRYIKKTQGILKWKQHYTSKPNRKFWKQVCYRMPPVPRARTAVVV
ncbi:interleukin-1 receptor type 1 [Trichomycterus rosablanca]|uniref:interleukin-1 receptor type 1 n=1 Tax=Trichomycterus rosablanca TaxID=2290929 RepID=UPI002F355C23